MTCPICGQHNFWTISAAEDLQAKQFLSASADDHAYDWRLCRQCGNAYPSRPPKLQILERLWALNRTDAGSQASEKTEKWNYRHAIAKAGAERSYRLFAPFADGRAGRFLDIACGLGETVRVFADNGWDAEGIDADPSTQPSHRELGIHSRIGQLEQVEIGSRYDVVHIAHAIYFITNPMNFLRMVRECLAARGLFCVVLADFMANTDPALPSYVHTFFPTAASMRYALALAGFQTVLCHRLSGSIFIAARTAESVAKPFVWPSGIHLLYRTKTLRYALLGRPYRFLARTIKRLIGHR